MKMVGSAGFKGWMGGVDRCTGVGGGASDVPDGSWERAAGRIRRRRGKAKLIFAKAAFLMSTWDDLHAQPAYLAADECVDFSAMRTLLKKSAGTPRLGAPILRFVSKDIRRYL